MLILESFQDFIMTHFDSYVPSKTALGESLALRIAVCPTHEFSGRACGVSRAVIAASITTNEASELMVRLFC